MKRKSNDISLFNDNANKSLVTQMAALAESAATHDAMYVCAGRLRILWQLLVGAVGLLLYLISG